jgi:SlyX protein
MTDKAAMTDKGLADRIDALETRLTYQDDAIESLNQTITAQWKQIDALTRQLAALREQIAEAEANAPAAANERPPHY